MPYIKLSSFPHEAYIGQTWGLEVSCYLAGLFTHMLPI
jgi:hypothetical protein